MRDELPVEKGSAPGPGRVPGMTSLPAPGGHAAWERPDFHLHLARRGQVTAHPRTLRAAP